MGVVNRRDLKKLGIVFGVLIVSVAVSQLLDIECEWLFDDNVAVIRRRIGCYACNTCFGYFFSVNVLNRNEIYKRHRNRNMDFFEVSDIHLNRNRHRVKKIPEYCIYNDN